MLHTSRPEPFFIADNAALDFLNSVAAPWGKHIEWIENGQDLVDWLQKSNMISMDDANILKKKYSEKSLDDAADKARKLRDWFRILIVENAHKPIKTIDLSQLDTLNAILATEQSYRQIGLPNIEWRQEHRWLRAEDLLLPIANAMGDLLCEANMTMVKNCHGKTCGLWFLDTSKNHKRAWCTMSICGNRAKAAAHRAKKRKNEKA